MKTAMSICSLVLLALAFSFGMSRDKSPPGDGGFTTYHSLDPYVVLVGTRSNLVNPASLSDAKSASGGRSVNASFYRLARRHQRSALTRTVSTANGGVGASTKSGNGLQV